MNISEAIEHFIKDLLTQSGGEAIDLRRNELANRLGCVPSQINYVISTRFTNEHGYTVESRRGGGGYIRIAQKSLDRCGYIMHTINGIGDTLTAGEASVFVRNCAENGYVTSNEARLILSAVGGATLLPAGERADNIRARIIKNMLLNLI